MIHDAKLAISIGASRKETSWKNKEVLWSDLVKKFSNTHRTAESYKQYVSESKDRQAEIKDIGGFVGGHILNGRRKNGAIMYRSMVTLDIDFHPGNIWEDYTMLYGEAAAMYTTHKHAPEAPRYRLIIPLNRTVLIDEYEAIARRIAGILDIEVFDTTTFEPTRLMYWASTSKDGVFLSEHQDGPFMDADKILSSYTDWRDSTQWPISKKEIERAKREAKKQGDPTAKEGLIGAFCRTYNIHEAIEKFLYESYIITDDPNRYTYKHGSTAAGLVVYDALYAYSHHGTDPASNICCNAFDLVRMHIFGLSDENQTPGSPTNKLPSYKQMLQFAGDDGPTRITIGTERFEQAQRDFETTGFGLTESETEVGETSKKEIPVPIDLSWMGKLEYNKKGQQTGELKQSINNGVLILENDTKLNKCFGYDEFSQRKVIRCDLPWRKVTVDHQYLKDEDEAALRLYLERSYGLTSRMAISDALDTHIFKRSYHPIREYFAGLKWDNKPRVDRLLIKYMGADNSKYIRAITRKVLVAAVARIYEPGIKFDYVLTMAGEEGKGKSTLIRKLGGLWFSDNFDSVEGTRAMEQIQGKWLIEMAELKALKRAEVYSIKSFVSKQEDEYRPAYGHNKIYSRRQCIFFTTTNEVEFLRGADGNRRFWIVDVHGGKVEADILLDSSVNEEERAQIWAEAKYYYEQGEKLYLDNELEAVAREHQKLHGEHDDRLGIIQEYLDMKLPLSWESWSTHDRISWINESSESPMREPGLKIRDRICVTEIWVEALRLMIKDLAPYNARPIHDLMKRINGWSEYKKGKLRFGAYGPQKAYVKNVVNELIS